MSNYYQRPQECAYLKPDTETQILHVFSHKQNLDFKKRNERREGLFGKKNCLQRRGRPVRGGRGDNR
jgi:hypothetical protein